MSNPKQINKPPKPIKTTIIKPLCFNPWVLLSHTMRPSRCSLSLIPSCSLTHSFPSSSTPPSRQLPHAYTLHLSLFPFKRGLQQGRQILLHACSERANVEAATSLKAWVWKSPASFLQMPLLRGGVAYTERVRWSLFMTMSAYT